MATAVTLKESDGSEIYPVTDISLVNNGIHAVDIEATTPVPAVETAMIADGAVTKDKIDTASLTESYSISGTPAHSGGTNYYQLKKVLNIVALNIRDIWANSVSAQTWLTLGTIPSAVRPNDEVKAVAAVYAGATGNIIDYAHASVKADGTVRVKTTSSYGSLVGFCFSITWVIS